MERERGDERGGDQAIWLDLVARLEQATADEHAVTPWPDSENLGRDPLGSADPANAPANRGRVIRPASFMRFADPPGRPAEPDGEDAKDTGISEPGDHDRAPATKDQANQGAERGNAEPELAEDTEQAENNGFAEDADLAEDTGFTNVEPWRASARNLTADDYLNLADLGYIDYDTGDAYDRYIPPPLPPQPKLDPVAKGAWTALLGGPGYLLLAALLSWQVPGWAQLVAVIAFIVGFLVLVSRLGDGPSRRDGPDQGAVV